MSDTQNAVEVATRYALVLLAEKDEWRAMARKLAAQLTKIHKHNSESLPVFFEQDGRPIAICTDLGEAYQESEMCAKNCATLNEFVVLDQFRVQPVKDFVKNENAHH
jgi:hypothetical protein